MLSNIAALHPQVVHFVVALLFVGVIFRVISLTGKLAFTSPAATTLILIGTVAAWFAVLSGDKAHGPVERIPGVRDAVEEHEEWGERTRNLFIVVSLLELGLLVTTRTGRRRTARGIAVASAVVGLGGLFSLYEAAEHGGEIVYAYGGGPGLRSGDAEDIQRLLVAGLYNQAMVARRAGRGEEAGRLIDELARIRASDANVGLLRIESAIFDRQDAAGALLALESLPPAGDARQRIQRGILRADAHKSLGNRDSARSILETLARDNPENSRIRAKVDSLR